MIEYVIVASRGRNPDLRVIVIEGRLRYRDWNQIYAGGVTRLPVSRKTTMCLRFVRNQYGKAMRKKCESGSMPFDWGGMRDMEPRTDGLSNTISTVQKDNLLLDVSEVTQDASNPRK